MKNTSKDFITLDPYSGKQIEDLLDLAKRQKADPSIYRKSLPLAGKVVGILFEKPSLRTRLGFEVAVYNLGGQIVYLGAESVQLGKREAIKDVAAVSGRFLDGLVLRTMHHETILSFAKYAGKPVINGLSDFAHPCQALADLLTIQEKCGRLKDIRVAYVGDANNVCRSLALGLQKCGGQLTVASPDGYQLDETFLKSMAASGAVKQVLDPAEAVDGVDVVYADVWTSMGQEAESAKRLKIFQPYQINAALMAKAPNAFIMHCLPAHRGEEITDEVLDCEKSVVFDQAENRLHVQRALLDKLLSD